MIYTATNHTTSTSKKYFIILKLMKCRYILRKKMCFEFVIRISQGRWGVVGFVLHSYYDDLEYSIS